MKSYNITPIPKPRMTQRDKWKKRPCVERYYSFKDQVRLLGIKIPESGSHITFIIPMPKSWSKKKKNQFRFQPHQQTPDKDNLEKALLDAVFESDAHIWDSRVTKIWGDKGRILITEKEQG